MVAQRNIRGSESKTYLEEGETPQSEVWHNRSFPGHPGAKFAHFGDSEDAPKARGDLKTSMEPPANFAPDPINGTPLGFVQGDDEGERRPGTGHRATQ